MLRFRFSLALVAALSLGGAAAAPASAEDGQRREDRARQPQLEDLEEQVLRAQVDLYLNEFARWDADSKRVVIKAREGQQGGRGGGELGGLEVMGEMMLQRMIEPDAGGRLHLKPGVKLRPFAKVAQDFIAEGGMEDVEAFQRFRAGKGENPFKKGIPPRIQKLVAGTLKALNEQDLSGAGDRKAVRRDAEEDAPPHDDQPVPEGGPERDGLRGRIAKRLDLSPEELEALERYARDLAADAGRDMERMATELRERARAFAESEDGRELAERARRLARRAEDELRRALAEEENQERLESARKRAMDFLASEEGRRLQERFLDFLESERGRDLRRRIDIFLDSEEGRALLKRVTDGLRGDRGRDERRSGEERPGERPAPRERGEAQEF